MGIGFSPGCECCSDCLGCTGKSPAKLQFIINGVADALGLTCCGDFNNTFLLPITSNACVWQLNFNPAGCMGIVQFTAKLNFDILNNSWRMDLLGSIIGGLIVIGWSALFNDANPQNCLSWNNVNLFPELTQFEQCRRNLSNCLMSAA